MTVGVATVGTAAVELVVAGQLEFGMRILARAANSGSTYLGTSSGVTTSTGVLVPQGAPGSTFVMTVPASHFAGGGRVYLIGSAASQLVDYTTQ